MPLCEHADAIEMAWLKHGRQYAGDGLADRLPIRLRAKARDAGRASTGDECSVDGGQRRSQSIPGERLSEVAVTVALGVEPPAAPPVGIAAGHVEHRLVQAAALALSDAVSRHHHADAVLQPSGEERLVLRVELATQRPLSG